MPRQPLAEISANSKQRDNTLDRFELTSNWHSHIINHACNSQSSKNIAKDFQMPISTIYSTISCNESHYNNESLY